MARHGEVDVARELHEPVDEVELTGPPGEVVRVRRMRLATDAQARIGPFTPGPSAAIASPVDRTPLLAGP